MKRLLLALAAAVLAAGVAHAQNVNPQTAATYTVLNTDCSKLLTFTNAASVAITLPQPSSPSGGGAGAGTFMPPCAIIFQNTGSLPDIITPTSSTIDGATTLSIPVGGMAVTLISDGANWHKGSGFGGLATGIGTNILDNGDFNLDRANAGASLTLTSSSSATYRSVDRWISNFNASSSSAGNPTSQQVALNSSSTLTANELKFAMNATPSTTVPAALILKTQQTVEGATVNDLQEGSANAEPVTYSFWAKISVAGTYGVFMQNSGSARSYVTSCTVAAATATLCTGTIPGDTGGTWYGTQNTVGLIFGITLACGSTNQHAAGAWGTFTGTCPTSQTQLTATASATAEIWAPKLERGTYPTPFVSDPWQVSLAKAAHWYKTSFKPGTAAATNAGVGTGELLDYQVIATADPSFYWPFDPPIYHVASPTVTTYSPGAATAQCYDETGSAAINATPNTTVTDTGIAANCNATQATIGHLIGLHVTVDTGF